jgi:hypothetical protein
MQACAKCNKSSRAISRSLCLKVKGNSGPRSLIDRMLWGEREKKSWTCLPVDDRIVQSDLCDHWNITRLTIINDFRMVYFGFGLGTAHRSSLHKIIESRASWASAEHNEKGEGKSRTVVVAARLIWVSLSRSNGKPMTDAVVIISQSKAAGTSIFTFAWRLHNSCFRRF